MARFATGGLTTAVPTAARGPSLYGVTTRRARVRKISVFNTTTTAMAVAVQRATTTGTQGAAVTKVQVDDASAASAITAVTTHTADATIAAGEIESFVLGAQIGSGVVWTYGEAGLVLPELTTAGIVITCPSGTGQQIRFSFTWDE